MGNLALRVDTIKYRINTYAKEKMKYIIYIYIYMIPYAIKGRVFTKPTYRNEDRLIT